MRLIFTCLSVVASISCIAALGIAADDEPKRVIKGWGEVTDYYYDSKIDLDGETLVITGPGDYADNYINGKTTAPRVMQKVSGDFVVEVKVADLDRAKAGTVFERLGDFPTAFHSGTLLIRHDQNNFVRFERESMNTNGSEHFLCALHIYKDGKRPAMENIEIKDGPLNLRLERRGKKLLSSYSQDDGKTWKEIEEQNVDYLPDEVEVGVSMSCNTDPPCTVKFEGLKIEKLAAKR